MILFFMFLLSGCVLCSTKEGNDNLDRYIIACHTTDFECFKRQHKALRDLMLGNKQLSIDVYEPYVFQYADTGTCVKLSGIEDSKLVAISMDAINREYSIILQLPVKMQQLDNFTKPCANADHDFKNVGPHYGPLKKFSGNATVQITYPFKLRKKNGEAYMILEEENVDVILDIPNLSNYNRDSEFESKLFECSEWAYSMAQHVDIGHHCMLPFTNQLRKVMEQLPLKRFLLLYPEEMYSNLQFMYSDSIVN